MIIKSKSFRTTVRLFLSGLLLCTATIAIAGQNDNQGKGKDKSSQSEKKNKANKAKESAKGTSAGAGFHFTIEHQNVTRQFYSNKFAAGDCPPGLAKKNNGCQPPGQAKKWRYGQPLTSDVPYYDVPVELLKKLGRAPDGHKYVRVATDILLIAIGTAIVVDAIEDLGDLL